MAKKKKKGVGSEGGGLYYQPSTSPTFFSSGCTLLDCVLGGGWAENRIINIVGDKSTGKTLLAIEACANFFRKHKDNGVIYYNEAEAAFDTDYAQNLGLPVDNIEFVEPCFTVENLFNDLHTKVTEAEKDKHYLYILDSLDALSDQAELEREINAGSYGANKAKKMSELFRKLIQPLSTKNFTLIVISQIRDKMNVSFGNKHGRSGGRALDFYSSQILNLAHTGQIKKQSKGITRVIGVSIKAQLRKSKVGLPFRECSFPIIFMYGIDDLQTSVDWFKKVSDVEELLGVETLKEFEKKLTDLSDEEFDNEMKSINTKVIELWKNIEDSFKPSRSKY